jgi:hypothetical protein
MLALQVYAISVWAHARRRLEAFEHDDRGQAYAEFLWVALGVAAVIAIGTILFIKFRASAEAIPTNAPGIPGSGGNPPVTSPT